MISDDLREIRHRAIGELDRVTIQDPPEGVADRKALVQDGEEGSTQLPPWLARSSCGLVVQIFPVPCPLQCPLVQCTPP